MAAFGREDHSPFHSRHEDEGFQQLGSDSLPLLLSLCAHSVSRLLDDQVVSSSIEAGGFLHREGCWRPVPQNKYAPVASLKGKVS